MTQTSKTRYTALRGFWYPATVAGYEIAKTDESVRPGDARIKWARVEEGRTVTPPYAAIEDSWLLNRQLVKEVD